MKKENAAAVAARLAAPLAQELGLRVWDVEFVREGAAWYLRVYIDRDGGVTLDDCERFHRRFEPLVDEAAPVEGSYFLEISSPGTERLLKKPAHFEQSVGRRVTARFVRPDEAGRREVSGVLAAFEDGEATLTLDDGSSLRLRPSAAVRVRTVDDWEDDGAAPVDPDEA